MKVVITIFIMLAFIINYSAEAKTRNDDILNGYNPSVMASGTFSIPKKISAKSYESAYGYLFSLGILISSNNGKNAINSMSILLSKDSFALKEIIAKDENATISSIHISNLDHLPIIISKSFLLMPYTGGSTGISKFAIPDDIYKKLDKTTLTELIDENNDIQASGCWKFGVQASLKDLIPGLDMLSATYSYDIMTISKAWMPWHSVISTAIFGTATSIIDYIGQISPNNALLGLTIMAIKVGASVFWYNFDYDHHNWPFKDYEPLKYHRQSVSFSSAF